MTRSCRYCATPASRALLWAEGKAFVPLCEASAHERFARGRVGDPAARLLTGVTVARLEVKSGWADDDDEFVVVTELKALNFDWNEAKIIRDKAGKFAKKPGFGLSALLDFGDDYPYPKAEIPAKPLPVAKEIKPVSLRKGDVITLPTPGDHGAAVAKWAVEAPGTGHKVLTLTRQPKLLTSGYWSVQVTNGDDITEGEFKIPGDAVLLSVARTPQPKTTAQAKKDKATLLAEVPDGDDGKPQVAGVPASALFVGDVIADADTGDQYTLTDVSVSEADLMVHLTGVKLNDPSTASVDLGSMPAEGKVTVKAGVPNPNAALPPTPFGVTPDEVGHWSDPSDPLNGMTVHADGTATADYDASTVPPATVAAVVSGLSDLVLDEPDKDPPAKPFLGAAFDGHYTNSVLQGFTISIPDDNDGAGLATVTWDSGEPVTQSQWGTLAQGLTPDGGNGFTHDPPPSPEPIKVRPGTYETDGMKVVVLADGSMALTDGAPITGGALKIVQQQFADGQWTKVPDEPEVAPAPAGGLPESWVPEATSPAAKPIPTPTGGWTAPKLKKVLAKYPGATWTLTDKKGNEHSGVQIAVEGPKPSYYLGTPTTTMVKAKPGYLWMNLQGKGWKEQPMTALASVALEPRVSTPGGIPKAVLEPGKLAPDGSMLAGHWSAKNSPNLHSVVFPDGTLVGVQIAAGEVEKSKTSTEVIGSSHNWEPSAPPAMGGPGYYYSAASDSWLKVALDGSGLPSSTAGTDGDLLSADKVTEVFQKGDHGWVPVAPLFASAPTQTGSLPAGVEPGHYSDKSPTGVLSGFTLLPSGLVDWDDPDKAPPAPADQILSAIAVGASVYKLDGAAPEAGSVAKVQIPAAPGVYKSDSGTASLTINADGSATIMWDAGTTEQWDAAKVTEVFSKPVAWKLVDDSAPAPSFVGVALPGIYTNADPDLGTGMLVVHPDGSGVWKYDPPHTDQPVTAEEVEAVIASGQLNLVESATPTGVIPGGYSLDGDGEVSMQVDTDGSGTFFYEDGSEASMTPEQVLDELTGEGQHKYELVLSSGTFPNPSADASITHLFADEVNVALEDETWVVVGSGPTTSVYVNAETGQTLTVDATGKGVMKDGGPVAEGLGPEPVSGFGISMADLKAESMIGQHITITNSTGVGLYASDDLVVVGTNDTDLLLNSNGDPDGVAGIYVPWAYLSGATVQYATTPAPAGTTTPDPVVASPSTPLSATGNLVVLPGMDPELVKQAQILDYPTDYPWPQVPGAPPAKPVTGPGLVKGVSLRAGDVFQIDYLNGETVGAAVTKVSKTPTGWKVGYLLSDGTTGLTNLGPDETVQALARTPQPKVTGAARKAKKALIDQFYGGGRATPAAPADPLVGHWTHKPSSAQGFTIHADHTGSWDDGTPMSGTALEQVLTGFPGEFAHDTETPAAPAAPAPTLPAGTYVLKVTDVPESEAWEMLTINPDGSGVVDGEPVNAAIVNSVVKPGLNVVTNPVIAPTGPVLSPKTVAAAKMKPTHSAYFKPGAVLLLPLGGSITMTGKQYKSNEWVDAAGEVVTAPAPGPGTYWTYAQHLDAGHTLKPGGYYVQGVPSMDAHPSYLTNNGSGAEYMPDGGQVMWVPKSALNKKGAAVGGTHVVPGSGAPTPTYAPPPPLPDAVPVTAAGVGEALMSTSGWKSVGPQAGSNPGGLFESTDGTRFYVKAPKSADRAENEVLAAKLYAAAGVKTPQVTKATIAPGLIPSGGPIGVTSKIMEGKKNLGTRYTEPAYRKKIVDGFAVDAWLANWDAGGTGFDNMIEVDGEPMRIDVGGSLLFRAQGTAKDDAFGDTVGETLSMTSNPGGGSSDTAKVMGKVTKAELKASFEAHVATVSPQQIDDLVDSTMTDLGQRTLLKARLKARRADLAKQVGVVLPENKPVVVPTVDVPGGTVLPYTAGTEVNSMQVTLNAKDLWWHTSTVPATQVPMGSVVFLESDPSAPWVVTKVAPKPEGGNAGGKMGLWGKKEGTGPETFMFIQVTSSQGERQVAVQTTPAPGWAPPPPPPPPEPGVKVDIKAWKMPNESGSPNAGPKIGSLYSSLSRDHEFRAAYKLATPEMKATMTAAGFGTADSFVSKMQSLSGSWDGSSNGSNDVLAFHHAVAQEFGLADVAPWGHEQTDMGKKQQVKTIFTKYGQAYRAMARLIYTNTQNVLASNGIEHVKVVRGFSFAPAESGYSGSNPSPPWSWTPGLHTDVTHRPLNSFAWKEIGWGSTKVEATVPRQAIFAIGKTGPGGLSAHESEVVVLGIDGMPSNVKNPVPPSTSGFTAADFYAKYPHWTPGVDTVKSAWWQPKESEGELAQALYAEAENADWIKLAAGIWPFVDADEDEVTTLAELLELYPDTNPRELLSYPVARFMPPMLRDEILEVEDDEDGFGPFAGSLVDEVEDEGDGEVLFEDEVKALIDADDPSWV